MLAPKAEEGIAAAEYIHSGHGHVNYGTIPSVAYTHPEVAWVGKTEQERYTWGTYHRYVFGALLREAGVPRCCIFIIGPNTGEMIAKAVLALEHRASAEDIARTTYAHVRSLPFSSTCSS